MIRAPGTAPAQTQEAHASSMRGRQTSNPNYVVVLNPMAGNGKAVIHRNKANHYQKTGRGEYVPGGFMLSADHPDNIAAKNRVREATAAGYDSVTDDFERFVGKSDGASVWMTERLPAR